MLVLSVALGLQPRWTARDQSLDDTDVFPCFDGDNCYLADLTFANRSGQDPPTNGTVVLVRVSTGGEAWRATTWAPGWVGSGDALGLALPAQGVVCAITGICNEDFFDCTEALDCFNVKDGEHLWSRIESFADTPYYGPPFMPVSKAGGKGLVLGSTSMIQLRYNISEAYLVDPRTGAERWRVGLKNGVLHGAAFGIDLMDEDSDHESLLLQTRTPEGVMEAVALETATGALKWRTEGLKMRWNDDIGVEPFETDALKIMAYNSGTVFAFDKKTGAVVWKYQTDISLDNSWLEGGMLYLAVEEAVEQPVGAEEPVVEDRLLALDVITGKIVWETSKHTPAGCSIEGLWCSAGEGGDVCWVEYRNTTDDWQSMFTSAFDAGSGKQLYTPPVDEPQISTDAVLRVKNLIIGRCSTCSKTHSSAIVAVEAGTGKVAWEVPQEGEGGQMLLNGTTLYAPSYPEVFAIDAIQGVVQWTAKLDGDVHVKGEGFWEIYVEQIVEGKHGATLLVSGEFDNYDPVGDEHTGAEYVWAIDVQA